MSGWRSPESALERVSVRAEFSDGSERGHSAVRHSKS